jgi:hypothetical protein
MLPKILVETGYWKEKIYENGINNFTLYELTRNILTLEIFRTLNIKTTVFCEVTQCSLVTVQRFGEI